MSTLLPRRQRVPPRIVGRPPNDYAQELQEYLEDVDAVTINVNQALEVLQINTTTGLPANLTTEAQVLARVSLRL